MKNKNQLIGCCRLDCEKCDAKDNNIMLGYVNYSDEIDYFGYMCVF